MIPYLPTPAVEIAGLRINAWGVLVVLGIVVGVAYARRRAIRESLSALVSVDSAVVAVAAGFVGAHVVHVLAYAPQTFKENWTVILPWYGGYSSTGGFLGAAIAVPLFLRLKRVPAWAYADNLSMAFLLGWVFGRTGCFFAHDHIGRTTDFFLAVSFPSGPRHDLGLYEALVALSMLLAFAAIDRRHRPFHGFFTGSLLAVYGPARFGLDFLRGRDLEIIGRSSDARYLGLTPAQYGALGITLLGVLILLLRRRAGRQDVSLEACPSDGASGPSASSGRESSS